MLFMGAGRHLVVVVVVVCCWCHCWAVVGVCWAVVNVLRQAGSFEAVGLV